MVQDRSVATLLAGLPQLATDAAGAQQCRAAMASLPADKVCNGLVPHLTQGLRLAQHPHGAPVAAAAIACCPVDAAASLANYSKALCGHEVKLAKDRHGHPLLLAALTVLPPQLVAAHAEGFAGSIAECARHSPGASACIAALFERGSAALVLAELIAELPRLALSSSKAAPTAQLLCLVLAGAGAKGLSLRGAVDACLARAPPEGRLLQAEVLADSAEGSRVLEVCAPATPGPRLELGPPAYQVIALT